MIVSWPTKALVNVNIEWMDTTTVLGGLKRCVGVKGCGLNWT